MLTLRPYQEETLDALRRGFAEGKNRQVLYAPTGAGKTEMAIALLNATKLKGNRSAMILDRIVLCDQTSSRLQSYNIEHGVLQASHYRYRPYELIQICSAQTLERRDDFPDLKLLIIDEAHTTRQKTMEFIQSNPDVKVIGLTATPFTKGMGKIYDNVISTVTTKELVDQGVLCPLKVYIAKEIDMEGATKIAGEWSQDEVTTRGLKITGDIVAEWISKTQEIFGGPKKTIVFCAGVAHGEDLAKKFKEAGYNFISISYKEEDDYKKKVIEDFSKPDTDIDGLIATDILTKGFDVPDVMVGVSARPFSKSLSSHVQQMGRVMRGSPGKEFALWLDHSGNYLRFREDWDDVFTSGVSELDDSKEKAKKEPTKKEKEEAKCPKCHAFWSFSDNICGSCGYVRQRKSKVEAVAGVMQELEGGHNKDEKQQFWSMMQWYVRHNGWNDKRALATYKERYGVWPNGLSNEPLPPNAECTKYINKKIRAYLYKMGKIR
jgi:DNA repair protein RadD